MKSKKLLLAYNLVLLLVTASGVTAQGVFRNLYFESPMLPLTPDPSGYVPLSAALPGWEAYVGGSAVDRIDYNNWSLGGPMISLLGPGSTTPVLQGQYSVFLQPGMGPDFIDVAIAQTGMIPTSANSLQFVMARAAPEVLFAGQQLSVYTLGAGPGESLLYGVDVFSFGGLTGELRFGGGGILDAIRFSTNAVPEPRSVALVGMASVILVLTLRRRGK